MSNRMLGRGADEAYVNSHTADLRSFAGVPASYWAYYAVCEAANTHAHTETDGKETWISLP